MMSKGQLGLGTSQGGKRSAWLLLAAMAMMLVCVAGVVLMPLPGPQLLIALGGGLLAVVFGVMYVAMKS